MLPDVPLPERGSQRHSEGWMLVPGKGALFAPRTVALTFPSLAHLDARVDAIHEHMRNVDALSDQTIAWTRAVYRLFRGYLRETNSERSFLGGELDVQLRVFEGWIAWLRASGRSRTTVNNYWRGLSLLFVRIQRQTGMVNPMVFIATPKFSRREAPYLTREAATHVMNFVLNAHWSSSFERTRNVALIGLLLLTGLRRSEALKLRFGDVDLDEGTIFVREGKGRDGGKDRRCYMTPQLRAILGTYVTARARRAKDDATVEFLLSATRDGAIGVGAVQHLFRRISRAVGFSVTPHALRHTYATLLRQSGVQDRIAMELLGHASLDMLQRYSHVYNGEREAAAARLALDIDVPPAPPRAPSDRQSSPRRRATERDV